jgi:hypothetical protein
LRRAVLALAAFGNIQWNDVIALAERFHVRPDVDDHACPLMAENRRKQSFGISARQRELIGMADTGCLDLDQDLAGFGTVEVDRFYL